MIGSGTCERFAVEVVEALRHIPRQLDVLLLVLADGNTVCLIQ